MTSGPSRAHLPDKYSNLSAIKGAPIIPMYAKGTMYDGHGHPDQRLQVLSVNRFSNT